jgi:hypothetical protein
MANGERPRGSVGAARSGVRGSSAPHTSRPLTSAHVPAIRRGRRRPANRVQAFPAARQVRLGRCLAPARGERRPVGGLPRARARPPGGGSLDRRGERGSFLTRAVGQVYELPRPNRPRRRPPRRGEVATFPPHRSSRGGKRAPPDVAVRARGRVPSGDEGAMKGPRHGPVPRRSQRRSSVELSTRAGPRTASRWCLWCPVDHL